MTDNQLKALNMYLDVRKNLNNMSDKFASIGIIIDQEDGLSNITTVQDDYNSVMITLDDYIKGVLNLEYFYEEETFFETISEYLYGNETKENVVLKINISLNK